MIVQLATAQATAKLLIIRLCEDVTSNPMGMWDPPSYEKAVQIDQVLRPPTDNLQGRQQHDKPPPCRVTIATDDPVSLPDPPSYDQFSQDALHADVFKHHL